MRIKPRAIATVLCMIFFVGFAVCGVVRSTDKETLEIKQSYPVLAEAEPMIMADLLMESPNLTPEVEKEPDYPLTQEEIDFMAGGYSKYGEPLFQECCHYFSSYD